MDTSDIEDKLRQNKDYTDGTIKTYLSTFNGLVSKYKEKYKINLDNKKPSFLLKFKSVSKVIDREEKTTTQENRYKAVLIIFKLFYPDRTEIINFYSDKLNTRSAENRNFIQTQQKTETQSKNWITSEELKKVIQDLKDELERVKVSQFTPDTIPKEVFKKFMIFILLSLNDTYSIRNEWGDMEYLTEDRKDLDGGTNYIIYDKTKDNFKVILNHHKTVKKHGKKSFVITDETLINNLKIWFKVNNRRYLLPQQNKWAPLGNHGVTQLLTGFFKDILNKNISTSLIRHINATDDLKDTPTIQEMKEQNEKVINKYLHNTAQHQQYRKL